MKKIILILVLIISIFSCRKADAPAKESGFDFCFENPQPVNDSELDHFPNKFKGLYMSKDSTFLRIEEDRIIKESFYKFKFHKNFLDSIKGSYEFTDGKIIDKETNKKIDFLIKGDSIEIINKYTDTLFRFSYYEKAKRINGQLVLSRKDSIFWNIQLLNFQNNTLKITDIYLPEDLKKLDSVTAIKAQIVDSMSYLIRPTRREFKNILKIKNLGTDQEYHKLSK
ncbi:hypothetical protein AR687_20395 [Flavobacteriaceae bacterium CRH]|nr:hypothetical protein AR687_20395 [Flavobacteriaceae bacterium CRH]